MNSDQILMDLLCELGWKMSGKFTNRFAASRVDELAAVSRESGRTTRSIEIDRDIEVRIVDFFEKRMRAETIAVAARDGRIRRTAGARIHSEAGKSATPEFTILMDPLDGTRGLMYGKRSAWMLAGAARGDDASLTLRDIFLAVQTEITTAEADKSRIR